MTSLSTADPVARERVVGQGHEAFEAVRARVAAIANVGHPALDVPSRVTMLPGDAVAVVESGQETPTLQATLEGRGPLRAGECVWVGMAVAEALSALHRAGLAHGAVDASAVRLPSGGPVVGKLIDGAANSTPPDDVADLGRMLASCVSGPEAERVRAWTEPMTHVDPAARPTAAMVARALGSCAPPEPLQHPPRGVASSMRAAAAHTGTVRTLPRPRIWRWYQTARRWSGRRLLAVAVVVVAIGAWVAVPALTAPSPTTAPGAGELPAQREPTWVAREATQARFRALQTANGEALLRWTAAGTPARAEAEATALALASGRMVVDGLTATIDRVSVESAPVATPNVAVVRVTYTLSDHAVTVDGQKTQFDSYSQTVDLELVRDQASWLVRSAEDATPDEGT